MATANFAYNGAIQTYTVATTGEYNIQAFGAAGGTTGISTGGKGAEAGGIYKLTAGEQIEVVVGGQGQDNSVTSDGAGGGGGTFILANIGPGNSFVPLLTAGGGGGGGFPFAGFSGNGTSGAASAGYGGYGATGDGGYAGGGANAGGGGTGFKHVGYSAPGKGGQGGTLYNGGLGYNGGNGGFGGGGGGGYNGGGGGGGYTGGNGGQGTGATGGFGGYSSFTYGNGNIVLPSQEISGENAGNGSALLNLVNPTVTLTSTPATGPDKTSFTITGKTDYGTDLPLGSGSTVTLTDNGQTVGTATTAADGTFSASVTLPFAGANSVVATVVDPNGISGSSAAATYNLYKTVSDVDPISQEVERLYYSLLNRAADAGALALDDARLARRPGLLKSIANSLIKSREYHVDHGRQTNGQFVEALYEGALGRPADSGSLAVETHALSHGYARQALAVNVAEGGEAIIHLSTKPV